MGSRQLQLFYVSENLSVEGHLRVSARTPQHCTAFIEEFADWKLFNFLQLFYRSPHFASLAG
jgi:hypothetical protein